MFGDTKEEFIGGVCEPSWTEVDVASHGPVQGFFHLAGTSKGECCYTTVTGGRALRVSGRDIEDEIYVGHTGAVSTICHALITFPTIALDTSLWRQCV